MLFVSAPREAEFLHSCASFRTLFVKAKHKAGDARSDGDGAGPSVESQASSESLFSHDVHERYLELSRRTRVAYCDCCGVEAEEGGKKHQVCAACHRRAYCSAECQRMDWKEGGHKGSCRPQKDFRKDDVVVAHGVENRPDLNGQLMVVVGPEAPEGLWRVLDSRKSSISMRAVHLRLVVPAEERADVK